jgi:hypothetical protein
MISVFFVGSNLKWHNILASVVCCEGSWGINLHLLWTSITLMCLHANLKSDALYISTLLHLHPFLEICYIKFCRFLPLILAIYWEQVHYLELKVMICLRLILARNWREEYHHWAIVLYRAIMRKLQWIQLKMALVLLATMIQIAFMDDLFSSKLHM